MQEQVGLNECVNLLLNNWLEDYKQEARRGNIEAMIILSGILLRGFNYHPPDISQGLHWLKKACHSSPEASFRLAKYLARGKYIQQDLEKAFFYFKLTMIFRCKCGKMTEQYHSSRISNVHPCFPYQASQAIKKLPLSSNQRKRSQDYFNAWRVSNLRH